MTTATTTTVAFKQLGSLKNVTLVITGQKYGEGWGKREEEKYHQYLQHLAARDALKPGEEWGVAVSPGQAGKPSRIHGDAKSKFSIRGKPLTWWVSFNNGAPGEPASRVYTLLHGEGKHPTQGDQVFTAKFVSESISKASELDLKGFRTEIKAAFEALQLEEGVFEPEL